MGCELYAPACGCEVMCECVTESFLNVERSWRSIPIIQFISERELITFTFTICYHTHSFISPSWQPNTENTENSGSKIAVVVVDLSRCKNSIHVTFECPPYGGSLPCHAEQEIYFEITILSTEIYEMKSRHVTLRDKVLKVLDTMSK